MHSFWMNGTHLEMSAKPTMKNKCTPYIVRSDHMVLFGSVTCVPIFLLQSILFSDSDSDWRHSRITTNTVSIVTYACASIYLSFSLEITSGDSSTVFRRPSLLELKQSSSSKPRYLPRKRKKSFLLHKHGMFNFRQLSKSYLYVIFFRDFHPGWTPSEEIILCAKTHIDDIQCDNKIPHISQVS